MGISALRKLIVKAQPKPNLKASNKKIVVGLKTGQTGLAVSHLGTIFLAARPCQSTAWSIDVRAIFVLTKVGRPCGRPTESILALC